jgi:LPS export ABC transporter permease LptF/LPS export ABC transporter permease LptG
MRILTRYILREVTSHALIGVAIFTFVIFMRDLARILEIIVRASASLPSVAQVFFFTLPGALTITIPMGVLIGILIGLSRLASDSEITAMRACGMGSAAFVRALALFVIAAWLLGLANNLFLAPRSAAALSRLQNQLRTTQASFELQPRVFYENISNNVLYVQDVFTRNDRQVLKDIFVADVSRPGKPKLTLARLGSVSNEPGGRIRLHLENGSQHETDPQHPEQSFTSTFVETDITMPLPDAQQTARLVQPATEIPTRELLWKARQGPDLDRRDLEIEFHRRFALPTACLVLALVGIPLGLSSKKGGKSSGFVLTIGLVFLYYLVSLAGLSLARQGRLPVFLGLWLGNITFLFGGLLLLWRVDRIPVELASARDIARGLKRTVARLSRRGTPAIPEKPTLRPRRQPQSGLTSGEVSREANGPSVRERVLHTRFPLILDDYVLREFLGYLAMIFGGFLVLLLVFTLFELLRDILKNSVAISTIGEYLLNVSPYFVYQTMHLCVLLAVLVTLGVLQKSNEITAMKATGISVYRIVFPVLAISAALAGGLFTFDQFYLPHANKRQDALRNQIKGKPPQTYLRPERQWIVGEHSSIWYYEFFDPDQNRFGNISVFEFNPSDFELSGRISAAGAHWESSLSKWIFEQGWERSFQAAQVASFRTFDVATFDEVQERPEYFKKEVKQSSEMSYAELEQYIRDLQKSGLDVTRLRVQLQKKFAFPLMTLVMAMLAIPFALRSRRSALAGVATALGIALVYIVISGLFEAMGNANQLPPVLAAWSPDLIFALAGGYLSLKVPT